MDLDARLDALCRPLRADVTSGASEVAWKAADVFLAAALELPADSPDELRRALEALALRVLDAQPSMAPLLALAGAVLNGADVGTTADLEHRRHAAARAAADFRDGLAARTSAVAERAAALVASAPTGRTVATLSRSGTVLAALLRTAASASGARAPSAGGSAPSAGKAAPGDPASPPLRVLCFESRPVCEGRALAATLAASGIAVTFAVDAAADALVRSASVVLLGADSVGDAGAVNKIGSAALARAARDGGVPVYVLADNTKILPRGVPQRAGDDRPGAEVWPDAPPGVTISNRYFEVVALALVTGVVTESGVLAPRELERLRAGLDLPDVLRAWAEGAAAARTAEGRAHPRPRA